LLPCVKGGRSRPDSDCEACGFGGGKKGDRCAASQGRKEGQFIEPDNMVSKI